MKGCKRGMAKNITNTNQMQAYKDHCSIQASVYDKIQSEGFSRGTNMKLSNTEAQVLGGSAVE